MSLQDKIEEIRKKPEHIRLRYVWVLTVISAFFIIIIWILSISFSGKNKTSEPIQGEVLQELSNQGKSLKDAANGLKGVLENKPSMESQTPNEEDFNQ